MKEDKKGEKNRDEIELAEDKTSVRLCNWKLQAFFFPLFAYNLIIKYNFKKS